jgi:flavin-dependent dehydrogenase
MTVVGCPASRVGLSERQNRTIDSSVGCFGKDATMRRQHLLLVLSLIMLTALSGCSQPPRGGREGGPADAETATRTVAFVRESAREIPILYDVDVVVVGGTSGAVAAAVAAAENGAKVFLAAPRPHLGQDICGTCRLWLEPEEEPLSPLARAVFAEPEPAGQPADSPPLPDANARRGAKAARAARRVPPTPMQVKRVLDDALLNAGVQFLYGCYATDLLCDGAGRPAGIVLVNRSGRQAVQAKVVIDATERATVARMAGARFEPFAAGVQTFRRVVIGGTPRDGEPLHARQLPAPVYASNGKIYPATEYTLQIRVRDASFAALAEAEQAARDQTWQAGQVDSSETLYQVPPARITGRALQCCEWPGARQVSLDVFRPAGTRRLYVLGGCAHVSHRAAERMLRPVEFLEVGRRVGAAAAVEAGRTGPLRDVQLVRRRVESTVAGDIREDQGWMRVGAQTPRLRLAEQAVPVLGRYDVVVVGGGTGGAPAGIAAARQGARTLVVEYLHGLGGVGTLGLIGKYYYGNRQGFTHELDQGLVALGGEAAGRSGEAWDSQVKMEWYRRALRQAGADIWYGTLGCGALVEGNRVKGVVVATPQGRGVVLAQTVIDATGNAAIAAAAGARSIYITGEHIAVQGTGLPPWDLAARYTNTDFAFIDDLDVVDVWYSFLAARRKFAGAYDLGQLVDSRERRQVVGDFFLTPMDVYLGRTFPDTVVWANSNFDSHGYTIHPMFLLRPPDRQALSCGVPYRCLLPEGVEGMLVTGLAVSAHRDVMPVIRMQPDIQNQGYAAGVAAAMAARAGRGVRDIDVRQLQRHLVEKGNLPAEVLTHQDSVPLPKESVEQAVRTVRSNFEGIEVLFAQPEMARPLLRAAYAAAANEQDRLTYAHILGIMGDPVGADTLVAAVQARSWDEGWRYTGMGQYGMSMSPLDSLIVALGRTRQAKGLVPILVKVQQLGPEHALSHHRAVALALETLAHPAAAPPLAELLRKPGMTGHAYPNIEVATKDIPPSPTDNSTRECSLRELLLARALYRCGDDHDLGERILRSYAQDLRGHYARHALAILQERK